MVYLFLKLLASHFVTDDACSKPCPMPYVGPFTYGFSRGKADPLLDFYVNAVVLWGHRLDELNVNVSNFRSLKWETLTLIANIVSLEDKVFAKIGRVASEEVTLQLIKVKCLPALLYGLEACPLTKSDLQSLDFVMNRFFMKLFTTKNIEIVKYCQEYFGFDLPSVLWVKRVSKFESGFKCILSSL